VGVDYQVTENIFTYFSYSTGFKSGGYNEQASTLTAIGPFDEETADSYEIGIKSDLFDQRVRFNLAVFHVKYDGLQLDSVVPEPSSPVGLESRVTNAGKSTVWGVEAEGAASITDQLLIQASLGYLHSEYDSYACALGNPDARPRSSQLVDPVLNLYDCTFLDPKRAPKWTGSVRADYVWPLASGSLIGANVGVVYSDEYYNDTLNSSAGKGDDRTLLNASLRYTSAEDVWEVSLFGQNLTDKEYRTTGLGVANLWSFSTYGPPRTDGVEV
jgi:iron complex outermembrane receptor protein